MSEKIHKLPIRTAAIKDRQALHPHERAAADQALVAAAVRLVAGVRVAAAYVPMPGEPGGTGLVEALTAAVPVLLLPIVLPDRDLDWARYEHGGPLHVTGAWPVREPVGPRLGVEAIATAEVIFVPALTVDRAGTRLGRGGGSYDRALTRVGESTLVVALLYPGELVNTLPIEFHDRPVTAALLPSGLLRLPIQS